MFLKRNETMTAKSQIRIPVYRPEINELEKKYVMEALDTGWISSKGRFVNDFEDAFSHYTGISNSVAVCNGTVALHLAMLALGIKADDEVIVPSLAYIAPVNAVAYVNAQPVFADVDQRTWQMDLASVTARLTRKTKAVVAVHLYGGAADMRQLRDICDEHDIFLIEDCAEAIGTTIRGTHVGNFGHVATFSFFGNKTITTGEGGMVCANNKDTINLVRRYKGQGLAVGREYWHDLIGYNYRMTNICAAIGLAQLCRIEQILQRKRQLALMYESLLPNTVVFQGCDQSCSHSQWMVSCRVPGISRDRVRKVLAEDGIETRPVFYPVNEMEMYQNGAHPTPVSAAISKQGLNLPSYPTIRDSEIEEICQKITEELLSRDNDVA